MHDTLPETASVPAAATQSSGGTLYLVFTQVASRAFTFVGNQFLLNYLSPSLLGLAIQLEVLSVTILYFARESLRVSLQRHPSGASRLKSNSSQCQDAINLAYLAISVGLLVSVGFGYGYLQSSSDEVLGSVDFWLAFKLYAIATFIELLSEPCFVIIQHYALYRARARAETAAALAKCASACIAAVTMHARRSHASVLPFAVGQLFYSTALFVTYLTAVLSVRQDEGFSILPRRFQQPAGQSNASSYIVGIFSKPLLSLTTTFYAQSVFKLLLTQGDSLILSFLTDLKSQGAFALASNYGGLLSRLIFQPVEESSRNVFGRLLAPMGTDGNSRESNEAQAQAQAQAEAEASSIHHQSNLPSPTQNSPSSLSKALSHLTTTLHIYTLFTLPLLSILPPILPPLIPLLLRPQWRTPETTSLLQAYLHYIPFLAINGVLDAFITSVATPKQLRAQNLLMALVTGIYGVVAWTLMGTGPAATQVRGWVSLPWGGNPAPWGSSGLVYANVVNMAMRITYSVLFISRWVGKKGRGQDAVSSMWKASLPGGTTVVVAVAVGIVLRSTLLRGDSAQDQLVSKSFMGLQGLSTEDVGYILSGVVVLGTSILVAEYRFLLSLVSPLLPERLAAKIGPYQTSSSTKQE